MRPLVPLAGVVVAIAIAPFWACSDSPNATTDDAGAAGDRGVFEAAAESSTDSGPTLNAEGWVRIDYPNCDFYAAPSPDKMPAPLAWEACPSILAPLGLTCRQIKLTWDAPSIGTKGAGVRGAQVDASGKAWLSVGYGSGTTVIRMVAEADGQVHQAISYQSGECAITNWRLAGTKAVFTAIRKMTDSQPEERGALGGDVEGLPIMLEHWADGAARSFIPGPASYLSLGGGNAVRPYDPSGAPLGIVPSTDPGQIFPETFVGDDLFYQVGNLSYSRIKVYSPAAGARDLISFGNVVSANAADFGTDGVDMVWIEATGRLSKDEPWTAIDIMTSKFATDASNIQKRRVRSEKGSLGTRPFAVGCGYAAREYSSIEWGNGVHIVRLSDGHSWRLSDVSGDASGLNFLSPRALTCDELFVNVDDGSVNTLRIRLDSLGPGEPAD